MSTDNAGPGNPSSPDDSPDGEQPQDLLPGRAEAHEQELDSYGVPVQDRPMEGRAYLLAAGCLICGGVSASLAVMDIRGKLPGYLVTLGILLPILSFGLALPLMVKEGESKRKGKKPQLGRVIRVMFWAGVILALLGGVILTGNHCGNNCGV